MFLARQVTGKYEIVELNKIYSLVQKWDDGFSPREFWFDTCHLHLPLMKTSLSFFWHQYSEIYCFQFDTKLVQQSANTNRQAKRPLFNVCPFSQTICACPFFRRRNQGCLPKWQFLLLQLEEHHCDSPIFKRKHAVESGLWERLTWPQTVDFESTNIVAKHCPPDCSDLLWAGITWDCLTYCLIHYRDQIQGMVVTL